MDNYQHKYFKYKNKYENLKAQRQNKLEPMFDSGNGDKQVKRHLALCEILNFEGANKLNWDIIRQIYDPNVKVIMPDGTEISGIEKHIELMKIMYNMAPDIKIISHGIQFGSGDWTVVTQNMSGTFTGIFKTHMGKNINPTGNKFEIQVCSLIKWKNYRIIEERVFSDDAYFNKQLGISSCDLLNQMQNKI